MGVYLLHILRVDIRRLSVSIVQVHSGNPETGVCTLLQWNILKSSRDLRIWRLHHFLRLPLSPNPEIPKRSPSIILIKLPHQAFPVPRSHNISSLNAPSPQDD